MKIKRLVLGTENPGKIAEWQEILTKIIPVIGVRTTVNLSKPKETGKTFAENARQKASYYAKQIKDYVMGDDGGYEVEALGGAPGVKSRRILPGDKDGTDEELINYVLDKLKGLPDKKRRVKLTVAIAIADPNGKIIYEDTDSAIGSVSYKVGPVKIAGYPFRSIHWIPEFNKTYAELTETEHKKYSHKRRLAQRLGRFLRDLP